MLATLERAAHLIGVYVERTAGELGITQAEAHVLAQLARHGPTPIAKLQREFGHKPSTLTNILDRLERRKLVRRTLNPGDRRSFLISLTASGIKAANRVTKALDDLEREVLGAVTDRDVRGLEAIAAALAAACRPEERS